MNNLFTKHASLLLEVVNKNRLSANDEISVHYHRKLKDVLASKCLMDKLSTADLVAFRLAITTQVVS